MNALLTQALDVARDLLSGMVDKPSGDEVDTFQLRAGPYMGRELRVLSWTAEEAICDLFHFDIQFVARVSPDELQPKLLGQGANFSIRVEGGGSRDTQGLISELEFLGARAADFLFVYRARLVPRLWKLKKRTATRVFQDKSVPEVIDVILKEHGVERAWNRGRTYPKREYCVQYRETDYAFVKRLLAEEGIHFYFEHQHGLLGSDTGDFLPTASAALGAASAVGGALSSAGSALGGAVGGAMDAVGDAISDAAGAVKSALDSLGCVEKVVLSELAKYPSIEALGEDAGDESMLGISLMGTVLSQKGSTPTLLFRDEDGMHPSEEHVHAFRVSRAVAEKGAAVAEAERTKPIVVGSGVASHGKPAAKTSSAWTSAGAPLAPKLHEYYEHVGTMRYEPSTDRAKRLLEAKRRNALIARGQSGCRRLEVGRRFALGDHALPEANTDYVVTKLVHTGWTPELLGDHVRDKKRVYENSFECIPAGLRYRPKPPSGRVKQVMETARVVGPEKEEIHVDGIGRIRVQFHWDRDGENNEKSTCWVPVAQTWAGPGWGFQFIPRIGMQVVVLFEMGDVDRPLVVGCVPHQVNVPPFDLPKQKNVSGVRTRSTLGGSGTNENILSFDDTLGKEEVYLHAERDLRIEAENDHFHDVGYKSASEKGEGSQHVRVADDQKTLVGRDQETRVERHRREHVEGTHTEEVVGESKRTLKSAHYEVVELTRYDHVKEDHVDTVEKDRRTRVLGNRETLVYGADKHRVLDEYRVIANADVSMMAGETFAVNGTVSALIESLGSVRLACGESSLVIGPRSIVLESPSVVIKSEATSIEVKDASLYLAQGAAYLDAKDLVKIEGDRKVDLFSKEAHIGLVSGGSKLSLTGKAVDLQGQDSRLRLSAKAVLEASEVHINPGEGALDAEYSGATPKELLTSWLAVALVDQDGEPIPGARYLITMSNQDIVRGVLDRNGKARVPVVPGECQVTFPDLDGESWGKK